VIDRGRVQQVEVTARGDIVLRTGGGLRRFLRSDVGAIGFNGTVIAGRLSTPFVISPVGGSRKRPTTGRLVLLGPDGNLRGAWRAGWLAIQDLEAACRAGKVPWAGDVDISTKRLSAPPAISGEIARRPDAEAVRAAVSAMRRRSRVVLVRSCQAWGVALVVTILLHAVGAPHSIATVPDAISWIGGVGMIFVLGTQPLRSRAARATAKATAIATWAAADVAIVAGAPSDPRVRVVLILDPDSAALVDTWLVDPGGTSLWLQETERRRIFLTVAPDGRSAVATDESVERLAALRRSLGLGKSDDIHRWAREKPTW
jgi:hypothetical protein